MVFASGGVEVIAIKGSRILRLLVDRDELCHDVSPCVYHAERALPRYASVATGAAAVKRDTKNRRQPVARDERRFHPDRLTRKDCRRHVADDVIYFGSSRFGTSRENMLCRRRLTSRRSFSGTQRAGNAAPTNVNAMRRAAESCICSHYTSRAISARTHGRTNHLRCALYVV